MPNKCHQAELVKLSAFLQRAAKKAAILPNPLWQALCIISMNIIEQLTEQQVIQLHELYLHEWWCSSRTLEQTKSCVTGSQIVIGLTDDSGNLIGFTRVLTDYTFKALLFDVIVHQAHRKEALGSKLINIVKAHPKLQKVKHFELYCVPQLFDFYKKHGFSQDVGPVHLMRLENA